MANAGSLPENSTGPVSWPSRMPFWIASRVSVAETTEFTGNSSISSRPWLAVSIEAIIASRYWNGSEPEGELVWIFQV